MKNKVVLQVQDIKKRFTGTYALKGVSMELFEGEIHAIVGENGAGKSTLMNIISGVLQPTEGKIVLDGNEVHFINPAAAQEAGIGFVHQELALCKDLSVGNNIFIGHVPMKKNGLVDDKKMEEDSAKLLCQFAQSGKEIDPKTEVSKLSVAQQQMVEIAKALSMKCKVLIFDEPTSSLNVDEAGELFGIIRSLAATGIGILYISHKIEEIFELTDRCTILRDGQLIKTVNTKDTNAQDIVNGMVGKELGNLYSKKTSAIGKEVLKVEGITREPRFRNISFSTYKGEILGLCGLVGAGRTEIARSICGIDKKDSGKIFLEGKEITINCCRDAMDRGICYLTEDRKNDGLFLDMTVLENIMAPQIHAFTQHGFVSIPKAKKVTEEYRQLMNIKYSSLNERIGSLSGGNQQKLMIAKILAMKPKAVFLDEPTRGIDVGAKAEIHQLLRKLSNEGISVIMISSEMPEMIGTCDRIVIINDGNVAGELNDGEITQDNIIEMISSSSQEEKREAI
jgi:ribose transport system ATP-binding protein